TPVEWWWRRNTPTRPDYESRLAAGESLWMYHSCESHGCNGTGRIRGDENWPNFLIDSTATSNRLTGFLAIVHENVSGFLYWSATYAYAATTPWGQEPFDAWQSQYNFGGNGDGTLFYPGRPDAIGGAKSVPVESLRLKFIRDSMYDAAIA